MSEHLLADLLALREGRRLLVAALLFDRIDPLGLVNEVVLQLAEGLEGQPRLFGQRDGCTADDLLARVGQRFAVLVVEGAQDIERGPLSEGVEKGRPVARHDVDVAGIGVGRGEDAGPVDPLAARQHLEQVVARVDRKGQRLEPAVAPDVAEVHLPELELLDGADEVACGEVGGREAEQADERVRFESIDGHASFYQHSRRPAGGTASVMTIIPRHADAWSGVTCPCSRPEARAALSGGAVGTCSADLG